MVFLYLVQLLLIGLTATATVYFGSIISSLDGGLIDLDGNPTNSTEIHQEVTFQQAMIFPIYASASLLLLFFFFDYIQYFLIAFLIYGASYALYQLLFYIAKLKLSPQFHEKWGHILMGLLTCFIVFEWIRTGNSICHNILGCSLCVMFISTLRFPSLKVASLCLVLLLLYDVFWVFCSEYFFSDNVMVAVATKQATNPVHDIGQTFNIGFLKSVTNHIELPLKLLFPDLSGSGRTMMLGLGDIALPGALVSLALRSDISIERAIKFNRETKNNDIENHALLVQRASGERTRPYLFQYAVLGYFIGLLAAFAGNSLSGHPQPALIYLVPGVLTPIFASAHFHNWLQDVWNGPFKLQESH